MGEKELCSQIRKNILKAKKKTLVQLSMQHAKLSFEEFILKFIFYWKMHLLGW